MNFYHLKYFVDAARSGGISESARINFLTQSAISRAISKLEDDLGVELVLHKQNRFQLTEAGAAILEQSQDLLNSVATLKNAVVDLDKTLQGPLRIGCNQAIASKLIGPMLVDMEAQYPGIKPEIKLGNTDQVQNMIDNLEVDFGLVLRDGEVDFRYEIKTIYRGEFIVVKSPKLAAKNPLDSLIVSRTRKGGQSQKYFEEYKKAYGKPIEPKMVVSSWQVIMDLALAGYGAALVPRFVCDDDLKRGTLTIVKHKVKSTPFELCTIVAKGRALPKNAQAVVNWFEDNQQ